MDFRFSEDFLWGAASSAYQIEAACDVDGRAPSIYDYYSKKDPERYLQAGPEAAADFYHRFREDIALMKKMGLRTYRFSLCWSRILSDVYSPVNEKGIAYYNQVIDCLLENDIIPFFDLYHCDLPMFVMDRGGLTNPDFVDWFAYYAKICFEAFGDRVQFWSTVNEPVLNVFGAYAWEKNAPFGNSLQDGIIASYHMMLAHYKAVKLYRDMGLTGQIGAVNHMIAVYPSTMSDEDLQAAERYRQIYFGWWMEPMIKGTYPALITEDPDVAPLMPENFRQTLADNFVPVDFMGINYYNSYLMAYDADAPLRYRRVMYENVERDAYGFERYPGGMWDVMMYVKEHYDNLPIYITENGIALYPKENPEEDLADTPRINCLKESMREIHRCLKAGVNIKGYYHWTFVDTYEGNSAAYRCRFGLVQVDPATLKRTPRDSYYYYQDVISKNRVQ